MTPPTLPQDELKQALAAVQDRDVFLKATKPNDDVVWVVKVPAGLKWINPSKDRQHVNEVDSALSVLRHYQEVDVVPEGDVPMEVRRAAGGWFS